MAAYTVLAYDVNSFLDCLVSYSGATKEDIGAKIQKTYFQDYFNALDAKTLVIETEYIDHDFLEDYSAYYVRCFQPPGRNTARFHFFSTAFDANEFSALLSGATTAITTEQLKEGYLGFVVVKPLPRTIIGRTCLKTYPSDNGRRNFPILRNYKVSLFGIPLAVATLAYQEQDTVVAACATSALWSCFQGTGKLFQHYIPSPVEITKSATTQIPENLPWNDSRTLPNKGLTAVQMAYAIRSVGLEPYMVGTKETVTNQQNQTFEVTNEHVLNSTAYAYLRGRIPSILGIQLYDFRNGQWDHMGGHAVAVTGYSLGNNAPKPFGSSGFLIRASRIDKIYAHDDQIGPFSRKVHDNGYLNATLPGNRVIKATADLLILPLYHKIRIPFSTVHDAVLEVDGFLEIIRSQAFPLLGRQEWDVYLTTANEFKNDILLSPSPHPNREQILIKNLPRFLWRVTASCDEVVQLDLIFDATGIEQGNLLISVIEFGAEIPTLLATIAPVAIPQVKSLQARSIFEYFNTQPTP